MKERAELLAMAVDYHGEPDKKVEVILEAFMEIAMDSWYEAKSFGPHSFDTYWRSLTKKEG